MRLNAHIHRTTKYFILLSITLLLTLAIVTLPTASFAESTYDKDNPSKLVDSNIVAPSAVLIDAATGKILYNKDMHTKRSPASTTKVMTLLLALELGNLDDIVTIPEESRVAADSTLVPVTIGEKIKLRDLCYGFFIKSGNDGANAIAMHISGSLDDFAELMTKRAKELGCKNTNFTNAHGLTAENHYTTAYDMALIAQAAMKNKDFREIANTAKYTMPPTNKRPNELVVKSTNQFVVKSGEGFDYIYPDGIGIKTGFTNAAGQCLVAAAKRNGIELISVVFKSSKNGKWIDSIRLMEYGFASYTSFSYKDLYSDAPVDVNLSSYDPNDELNGILKLDLDSKAEIPSIVISNAALNDLKTDFKDSRSITYTRELRAPIKKGEKIATLTYTPSSGDPVALDLVASRDVAANPSAPLTLDQIKEQTDKQIIPLPRLSIEWLIIPAIGMAILMFIGSIRANQRKRRQMMRRKKAAKARAQRSDSNRNYKY